MKRNERRGSNRRASGSNPNKNYCQHLLRKHGGLHQELIQLCFYQHLVGVQKIIRFTGDIHFGQVKLCHLLSLTQSFLSHLICLQNWLLGSRLKTIWSDRWAHLTSCGGTDGAAPGWLHHSDGEEQLQELEASGWLLISASGLNRWRLMRGL